MGLDLLRKRLKELQENLRSGNTPEIPGMEKTYQPANQNPVETYNSPEVNVPDVQIPETTPISTSPVTQTNNPAVNMSKPTAKTTSNKLKVDPKTGANGAKAFDDITTKSPQFGEAGVGNTDLIDAYNAGLNGEDMSRETRDNAAAGGYLEQLEAMYNAGKQDAKGSSANDKSDNDLSTDLGREEKFSQKSVDNQVKSGYTPGNTTGNTNVEKDTADEPIQYTDIADNFGAPKQNTSSNHSSVGTNIDFRTDHNFAKYGQGEDEDDVLDISTSSNNSTPDDSLINKYEQDYNYIADMMFLNGAASSADPSVQITYQYITNPENKGKQIPPQVMKAYEEFMKGINNGDIGYKNTTQPMRDAQRKRSHEIAMGNADINNYNYEDIKQRNETLLNPSADMSAISQGYGVWYSDKKGYHMGIDIKKAGGKNSNICAPFYGEIVFKGWAEDEVNNDDNGYMIIIKHQMNIDGKDITFYSAYCHLDPTGTEGIGLTSNNVYPGDLIGIMGNTGFSTGYHLHFTIFTTTKKIDKDFNPVGYGSYQINDYAWKSSSSGKTIYYDPKKVIETNGAILG